MRLKVFLLCVCVCCVARLNPGLFIFCGILTPYPLDAKKKAPEGPLSFSLLALLFRQLAHFRFERFQPFFVNLQAVGHRLNVAQLGRI